MGQHSAKPWEKWWKPTCISQHGSAAHSPTPIDHRAQRLTTPPERWCRSCELGIHRQQDERLAQGLRHQQAIKGVVMVIEYRQAATAEYARFRWAARKAISGEPLTEFLQIHAEFAQIDLDGDLPWRLG